MNRHLALTFAGATAILVTAATGAIAANVGILGSGAPKSVGNLSASSVADFASTTVAPGAPVNVVGELDASAGSAIVPDGSTVAGSGTNSNPGTAIGSNGSTASPTGVGDRSTNDAAPSGPSPTSPPAQNVTPPAEPPAPTVTTSPYVDDDDDDDNDNDDDREDGEDGEDGEDDDD